MINDHGRSSLKESEDQNSNEIVNSDQYINIADGSKVSLKNWANGEPNRDGNCIMVDRDMNWHDKPCDTKLQSICQRPKGTLLSIR